MLNLQFGTLLDAEKVKDAEEVTPIVAAEPTDAYRWSDGGTIGITLTDSSLVGRGSGLPLAGDDWSLTVSDAGGLSGDGVTGQLANLAFDGTPAGSQTLVNAFFAANPFTDSTTGDAIDGNAGLGIAVPVWIATGTQYSYTSLSGTDSVPTQTQTVTATLALDGSISNVQAAATQSQSTYYQNSAAPGALYGAVEYSFDAAGQEDAEKGTFLIIANTRVALQPDRGGPD